MRYRKKAWKLYERLFQLLKRKKKYNETGIFTVQYSVDVHNKFNHALVTLGLLP
jgi:D-Tyr-tRNAtyr deacylase